MKREAVGPSERLCVALRYLATGDAQSTITLSYRLSPTTVTRILYETLPVIWTVLNENDYMKFPSCHQDFVEISKTFIDIGNTGRISDGGVLSNSSLNELFLNKTMFPDPSVIVGTDKSFPYVVVGDEAFPLKENLMKPYPSTGLSNEKRIFNYRLSRARRIIENTFGIMAARFRVLRRPIIGKVELVHEVTKSVVALHNYLMKESNSKNPSRYCPVGFVDNDDHVNGGWRQEVDAYSNFISVKQVGSNMYSNKAKLVRNEFKAYFNSSVGEVPWQLDVVKN